MGTLYAGRRKRDAAELYGNAMRGAAALKALGIKADDAVCVLLRNDFSFIEASMAIGHVGAFPVPINWHFKRDEVNYILSDSAAAALIGHADLLRALGDGIPSGLKVIAVETPEDICAAYQVKPGYEKTPEGAANWSSLIAQHDMDTAAPAASRGTMIYTSGTTGNPKGVKREAAKPDEAADVMANLMTVAGNAWGFSRSDFVAFNAGPLYHSAPNAYVNACVTMGADVVLQSKFDPEDMLRCIEEHKVTHINAVPTMFVRALALPEDVRRKYDLSSLEFVTHGAAPCPPDVKREMIAWWGPVINEYYGSTETGIITSITSEEWLKKPGSVGKPLKGATVKIISEKGEELPQGESGDIYVWMAGMPDFTYHGADDKRKAAGYENLVTLGDIGYLDADGYLYLSDRKAETVISGGVNIYPAEIEGVLHSMPGVLDCAVFGIPDDQFGEALCAYVQLKPGESVDAAAVQDWVRARMATYKVPRVVEVVDDLPRQDTGKIYKRKLRDPYWEGRDRKI